MNDRLRWHIQWSRLKNLWHCWGCWNYSLTKDQATLTHKQDCWVAIEIAKIN